MPQDEIRSSSATFLIVRCLRLRKVRQFESSTMGPAKSGNTKESRNDHICNLLVNSFAILLRWLVHPLALVANIEKAFLQLEIHPTDRDNVRFLWFSKFTLDFSSSRVITYKFKNVAFGLVAIPFL